MKTKKPGNARLFVGEGENFTAIGSSEKDVRDAMALMRIRKQRASEPKELRELIDFGTSALVIVVDRKSKAGIADVRSMLKAGEASAKMIGLFETFLTERTERFGLCWLAYQQSTDETVTMRMAIFPFDNLKQLLEAIDALWHRTLTRPVNWAVPIDPKYKNECASIQRKLDELGGTDPRCGA